jgi:hypothetical protein
MRKNDFVALGQNLALFNRFVIEEHLPALKELLELGPAHIRVRQSQKPVRPHTGAHRVNYQTFLRHPSIL